MRHILLAAVATATMATTALAHSPLKSTLPTDKAQLTKAPDDIQLTFGKPARVTKVVLVRIQDGEETRLKSPTKSFAKVFNFTPTIDGSGLYEVQWRALGEDGHALKGAFEFTIQDK